MIESYLNNLIDYIKRTNSTYRELHQDKLNTHAIPFSGNIETAKILAIGVNPPKREFKNRSWTE